MLSFITRRFGLVLLLLGLCHSLYANHNPVQIQIEGVKGELLDNVLASLSLEQQKNHQHMSASRIRRLHKQAPDEIKQALKPFGYYDVNVTSKLKRPSAKRKMWKARYVIKLGEPLKLQAVEININGDAEDDSVFQEKLAALPVKKGDTLNHPHYETAKRILRNIAEERGYFDAQLTQHEIRIDEQAYTASILLSFDSKRRYRFGEVIFEQDLFDRSFLARFLTFKPGDFYTGRALLAFQNTLTNSEYFDRVEVERAPTSSTEDLRLPVNVILEPRKANKYSAGIGYGTDTGVRGSLGWERRYFNRYGHRFSANTRLSEKYRTATARYYIPRGLHVDDFLAITAGYKYEITDTSKSELLLAGISKNHPVTWFGTDLSEIIGIEYRDERYEVGSDKGHSQLLMPYLNWSYMKADDPIYTRRGHKIQLKMRGALSGVGSNTSFWQSYLKAALIFPVLKNGRVIARGEVGYSEISLLDGDFHDLPPSIRFFTGGDRSVRGYDYEALGPKNEEGEVIGGKHLLVGSLEYEHKILDKWSLAVFSDIGNAFNGFSESLKQGAGVGVRWHSPVGLIRVDVATALKEDGLPLRLHIIIGPDL
jgi:translocation and assembly module TamA